MTPPRPIRSATGNEDPAASSTETIPNAASSSPAPPAVVVTVASTSATPAVSTASLTKSTAPSSFKALQPPAPLRSARDIADSIAMPPPPPVSVSTFKESSLRVHQGIVDKKALTGLSPPFVFAQVVKALQEMGIDIKKDGDFKLKCVRARKKMSSGGGATVGLGLSSSLSTVPVGSTMSGFSMIGFASSSSVSRCFAPLFFFEMLADLLLLLCLHRPTSEASPSPPRNRPPSSPPPSPL